MVDSSAPFIHSFDMIHIILAVGYVTCDDFQLHLGFKAGGEGCCFPVLKHTSNTGQQSPTYFYGAVWMTDLKLCLTRIAFLWKLQVPVRDLFCWQSTLTVAFCCVFLYAWFLAALCSNAKHLTTHIYTRPYTVKTCMILTFSKQIF